MIEVNGISKSFGSVVALNTLDFKIEKGEIFGIIGPDGAGKTTLFRILTTLLLPDSGKATINGWDVVGDLKKIRKMVGYMPGRFSLYPDLSVHENLQFFATIFGTSIAENYDVIKDIYIQIEPFKSRRAGKLSGGMKQKLALCCALIHNPTILFLDEPTTGVDAVSRVEFWHMLRQLKEKGITIAVSTPYMDEASLCDRIALLNDGQIMAIDEPGKITHLFRHQLFGVETADYYRCLVAIRTMTGIERALPFGSSIHVSAPEDFQMENLSAFLSEKGFRHTRIQRIRPTVEDVFLDLLQKSTTS